MKTKHMRLIAKKFGYNFWIGIDSKGVPFYNVTQQEKEKPNGGYYRSEFICKVKNVPNLFNLY